LDSLELAGRILLVLPVPTGSGAIEKSFRNLPNVKIAYARGLGTYDVLLADHILFTAAAMDGLTQPARPGPETQETPATKPEKVEEVAE
jgi:ribosomal protein L4